MISADYWYLRRRKGGIAAEPEESDDDGEVGEREESEDVPDEELCNANKSFLSSLNSSSLNSFCVVKGFWELNGRTGKVPSL